MTRTTLLLLEVFPLVLVGAGIVLWRAGYQPPQWLRRVEPYIVSVLIAASIILFLVGHKWL